MKSALVLLTAAIVGLVAGDGGAWDRTKFYKYKVEMKTANYSQSGNELAFITARLQMFIKPESDDLLVAKITDATIDKKFQALSAKSMNKESYMNMPISKPFKIHLRNGLIDAMSVDRKMSNFELNQLRIIVSQFQVDTYARNVLRNQQTQLPTAGRNTAYYETMERTAAGNCNTVYDISPMPTYLMQSQSEMMPVPDLKRTGDFIQISKSRDPKNCQGRDSNYLLTIAATTNDWNVYQAMQNHVNMSETRRIIVSGSLQRYTIQSSVAVTKVLKGTSHTPVLSESVSVKLEYVEPADSSRVMRPQLDSYSLHRVDDLSYNFDDMEEDFEEAGNFLSEKRFTPHCWTWHVWGRIACIHDFGRDYYFTGVTKNCGMGMRRMYECRRGRVTSM